MKMKALPTVTAIFAFGVCINDSVVHAAPTPDMTELVASDAASGDSFGGQAVIDGDIGVVFASSPAGRIYIFEEDYGGTGAWGERKKIVGSDLGSFTAIGSPMAIDGDTLAIGCSDSSTKVCILERDQGGTDNWGLVTSVSNSSGRAIALVGDTLVTAKNSYDWSVRYRNQGGTDNWGEVTTVTTDGVFDLPTGDVAISADESTIVFGVPQHDTASPVVSNVGNLYVFGRNQGGTDNWGKLADIEAPTAISEDRIGTHIAIHGDVIATAGYRLSVSTPNVYLFERDPSDSTVWTHIKTHTVPHSSFDSNQSASALDFSDDGNSLFFGHPLAHETTATDAKTGAIVQFSKDEGGTDNWGLVGRIVTCDNAANDLFGKSIDVSGNLLISGAPGVDVGAATGVGRAYISKYTEHGRLGIPSDLVAITGNETELATNTVRNEGDYIVGSTGDVTWKAGYKILINPGFKVQAGGEFEAKVESIGCDDI